MIYIRFFGDFSLSEGEVTLSVKESGAEKLFRALAYLVKHRSRGVEVSELSRFLHSDKSLLAYRNDSLVKTTVHRLRELLSVFGYEETITVKSGVVSFADALCFTSDTYDFTRLCEEFDDADEDKKIALFEKILTLYRGRYLAHFSKESFTSPESERYHKAFLKIADEALSLYEKNADYTRASEIAAKLLTLDPFAECFHYHAVYSLFQKGDRTLAERRYQNASLLFRREFHVTPSARFHALRELFTCPEDYAADSLDTALQKLSATLLQTRSEKKYRILDPLDLYRAITLLSEGWLVFIKGDVKALTPYTDELFRGASLHTSLADNTRLIVTTLDDEAFSAKRKALDTYLASPQIFASAEYLKICTSNKKFY